MDEKRNWIQVLTLALCAVLLGVLLWQWQKISALERKLSSVEGTLISHADSTDEQLYELYSQIEAQRPTSFTASGIRVNAKERTLNIALSADLALEEGQVEFRAYPPDLAYQSYRWSGTAVRNQEGVYAGAVNVPLEPESAVEFAAWFFKDGQEYSIVLGRVDRMAELLPVRLSMAEGSIHYDEYLHLFYWIEWSFQFEDAYGAAAEVEDLALRVYQNGVLAVENPARKFEGGYYDGEAVTQIECAPGDRIEFRLAYGDGSGLRYETPIRWWEIEEYQVEEHMPSSGWPVLTWPD